VSLWDTSTFAKLYVPEADSALFQQHADEASELPMVARLAILEMQRVVRFKAITGDLQPGEAESVLRELREEVARGEVRVVELDGAVERELERIMRICYSQSPPLLLRTADALHLCSASVARETEIVCTDKLMRAAATLLGFTLFPPA